MRAFVSRIAVAVVALPIVLGLVWLGGWWVFGLAAAAVLLALHELFAMTRPLRPVTLAGFAGGLGALLGAQLGGLEWMVAGFSVTFVLAFVLRGLAGGRASLTASLGVTVLGAGWIGIGIAHFVLVRGIDEHGRLAAFTVLLAVFAADTAAYIAGKVFGRHRMAPAVSPGKTWEGFLVGTAACLFVTWVSLYRTGFMDGWRSFVLGGVLALAAVVGDLFESGLKRDMQVKDSSRLLAGHGGMLDRLDALLFSVIAAYYVIAAFDAA
ncbi:MAG: phosphatidate cytidylyltransferase [Actinomycetota bacterium]|nr:phosphatidate cytidylyltransferase [Actinomycetota bacterium]